MFKKFILLSLLCVFVGGIMPNEEAPADGNKTIVLNKDNTLAFDFRFQSATVAEFLLEAQKLHNKLPRHVPLYVVLHTPGGSLEAGLEMLDNLNALGRTVHTITLFAASMGFQAAQGAPGNRYITPTGTMMAHKAYGTFEGEFPGQLDSRYQYYSRRISKLDEKTVARSNGKLTMQEFLQLYENEYWCEGQDCVDRGVADQVVNVRCHKSLAGTKEVPLKLQLMGMPIDLQITKARCPTITAVLDVKAAVSGKYVPYANPQALSRELNISLEKAVELSHAIRAKIGEFTNVYKVTK